MKNFRILILAMSVGLTGVAGHAGGLAEPITEPVVEEPFVPAEGSISGAYIMIGAFIIMALAAGSN